MLASTVQFSTYDQTPPTRPRQTPHPPQGARRYEKQDGPDRENDHPVRVARSLRTQQRAYDHRTPHRPRSTPTPKGRRTRSRQQPAGRTGQRSTLEHHPRHPRPPEYWATVTVRARLWTTTTRLAASAP